jgi:hypothetical protein
MSNQSLRDWAFKPGNRRFGGFHVRARNYF